MAEPLGVAAQLITDHLVEGRAVPGDRLTLPDLHEALAADADGYLTARNTTRDEEYRLTHRLSPHQRRAVLAGGTLPALAARTARSPRTARSAA
ncbi:hypothetical protein ACIRVF_04790 [Kitasatospora sp. NPDC101157]|uniref:hypothetical protein n=1 Tax=Kitasatospora sp. NPDC101157 TaxID=3364098 RepID=UPI003809BFB7